MEIFVDIETYPIRDTLSDFYIERKVQRLKDAKKIEEYREKYADELALSPMTGRIVCICAMVADEINLDYPTFAEVVPPTDIDENALLVKFRAYLNEIYNSSSKFITFNGKNFDFPFILIRAAKHGIDIQLPTELYKTDKHFDLLQNFLKQGTLNEWGYFFGVSDLTRQSGSEILALMDARNYDAVKQKCFEDIIITRRIYDKIKNVI